MLYVYLEVLIDLSILLKYIYNNLDFNLILMLVIITFFEVLNI